MSAVRDPQTGRLAYPIGVNVHLDGTAMPLFIDCGSWNAALGYLDSQDFKDVRARVTSVTITNREVP